MCGVVGYISRKETHPILVEYQAVNKIADFSIKLPEILECHKNGKLQIVNT